MKTRTDAWRIAGSEASLKGISFPISAKGGGA